MKINDEVTDFRFRLDTEIFMEEAEKVSHCFLLRKKQSIRCYLVTAA